MSDQKDPKKKKKDHEIIPEYGLDVPALGEVPRIKGACDQFHAFKVFGSRFIIDSRYQPIKGIGRGAYGVVVSAIDVDTNTKVAIKKVPRLFSDLVDAKRVLREVKLLSHFKHENIIGLRDLVPSVGTFEELYIIMDFMDTDLHKIIYSPNQLSDDHIQYFIYQLLRGLKYIHSANVVHRDLKPSNLLLNANCHLKICDFGLARGYKESDFLTEYVVTRWYRAPEIMCSVEPYDFKIDVWAAGCILAELLMRSPIFPGDDYKQQLNLMFNILGTPTNDDMPCITNEYALQYIQSLPSRPPIPLDKVIDKPDINPLAIDLLQNMLAFNPHRRYSIEQALAHPYLATLHDTSLEHTCHAVWDASFEDNLVDQQLTKEALQHLMLEEIIQYHPEIVQLHAQGSCYGAGLGHTLQQ